MPFVVELYMDESTDAAVRQVWQEIAEAGLSSDMIKSAFQPHVSLAVYQDIDILDFKRDMEAFAKTVPPFALDLASIGTFPTDEGVVFLAPTVTGTLLDVHDMLHEALAHHQRTVSNYYIPDRGTPHCTVAIGLKPEQVSAAIEVCRKAPLPLSGRFERIGVVEVGTSQQVKQLFTLDMGYRGHAFPPDERDEEIAEWNRSIGKGIKALGILGILVIVAIPLAIVLVLVLSRLGSN